MSITQKPRLLRGNRRAIHSWKCRDSRWNARRWCTERTICFFNRVWPQSQMMLDGIWQHMRLVQMYKRHCCQRSMLFH